MALSNSNIIQKLETSFIETIKNSLNLLDLSKEEKEKYILSKYKTGSTLNYDKVLLEDIRQLTILEHHPKDYEKFSSEEKRTHNEKIYAMNSKI